MYHDWTTTPGVLILPGVMGTGYLTGDFVIARIGFERVGTVGCKLEIDTASEILTDDPTPVSVPFTIVDGQATIDCAGGGASGVLGDMNGNEIFDMGDVRYLAIFIASSGMNTAYRPLYADGDVNSDGKLNMGDVRYLAIYYATDGTNEDFSPLYP